MHKYWLTAKTGFIQVRELSGNFFFKVMELSGNSVMCRGENEFFSKMSGNLVAQPDESRIFGPDVFFLLNS